MTELMGRSLVVIRGLCILRRPAVAGLGPEKGRNPDRSILSIFFSLYFFSLLSCPPPCRLSTYLFFSFHGPLYRFGSISIAAWQSVFTFHTLFGRRVPSSHVAFSPFRLFVSVSFVFGVDPGGFIVVTDFSVTRSITNVQQYHSLLCRAETAVYKHKQDCPLKPPA